MQTPDDGGTEWRPSFREWFGYRFQYWIILPWRSWLVRIRQRGEGRQRCKVCGVADGFNFDVPDAIWEAVVPPKFQCKVVCLACFDHFAAKKDVDYATSLSELCFAGDKACFGWDPNHAINLKPEPRR